jgi:hypothetical protein
MTIEIKNIDGKERGWRRSKQLPNDLVEKKGYRQLSEEVEQYAKINPTEKTVKT